MEINSRTLDEFRMEFGKAVQVLEEKFDCTISLGHITYSEDEFRAKITVNSSRDRYRIRREAFDREVWRYSDLGLEPGMYGRIFTAKDGGQYALVGFQPQKRTYPFEIIRLSDGQRLNCGKYFPKIYTDRYYAGEELE